MTRQVILSLLLVGLFVGTAVLYSGVPVTLGWLPARNDRSAPSQRQPSHATVPTLARESQRLSALQARRGVWLEEIEAIEPQLESVGELIAQRKTEWDRLQTEDQRVRADPELRAEVAPKVFEMGKTIRVGYTSYIVWRAWWADRLTGPMYDGLNVRPDAHFLFLELTVRNDDSKPRSIPPFRLIDEEGREYQTSSKAWAVEEGFGVLDSLNPAVSKQGVIVFDVPEGHRYRLRVLGGYWSSAEALIKLEPMPTR